MTNEKYNEEWIEYYEYLEDLRQSGVTNMYGGAKYLEGDFSLSRKESRQILISWMNNYDTLVEEGIITREE